jgi:hypothetical protein
MGERDQDSEAVLFFDVCGYGFALRTRSAAMQRSLSSGFAMFARAGAGDPVWIDAAEDNLSEERIVGTCDALQCVRPDGLAGYSADPLSQGGTCGSKQCLGTQVVYVSHTEQKPVLTIRDYLTSGRYVAGEQEAATRLRFKVDERLRLDLRGHDDNIGEV